MVRSSLTALMFVLSAARGALGQEPKPLEGVEARMRTLARFVDVGRPIWVEFSLVNMTDQAITLSTGGAPGPTLEKQMGLPLSHVFSGEPTSGGLNILNLSDNSSRALLSGFVPDPKPPRVILGPHSSVGVTVDLLKYYPTVLRVPWRYRLTWQPYGGRLASAPVFIDVAPLQQAEIVTDMGTMTLRFYYDDAPQTVANFLELTRENFYNGTEILIEPGHFLLCGDPLGDGTGIRKDGKKLPPEFNLRPHQKGSVSMALLQDDPTSASCQFFISNTRHSEWDGKYTVFAQLVGDASFEALDKLMAVPVESNGRPAEELRIRSLRLTNLRPEWADLAAIPGANGRAASKQ